MHRCSFSMKSSMSGRTLAATNDLHFLHVDSVSVCREFKLRLKKPWSGDEFRPLGGVRMVILQFPCWHHAIEPTLLRSNLCRSRNRGDYGWPWPRSHCPLRQNRQKTAGKLNGRKVRSYSEKAEGALPPVRERSNNQAMRRCSSTCWQRIPQPWQITFLFC